MFHLLTLDDKEWIRLKLAEEQPENCNYAFGTIYIWMLHGKTEVAELFGCLVLRHTFRNGAFYSFPIGLGDKKKAIEYILEDKSIPFKMRPFTVSQSRWLAEEFPGLFSLNGFCHDCDYVYLRKDLAELSGRRYHGKRNHLKHFTEKYDWTYESISRENIKDCRIVEEQWLKERDSSDRGVFVESAVVKKALDNFFELDFFGALIRVDGKPIAFTIAEKLNDKMVDVHIEKALSGYDGAYTAINKFFAQNECEGYEFINREDDAGDEGLRKSKMSYHPVFMSQNYEANEFDLPYQSQEELCAEYSRLVREAKINGRGSLPPVSEDGDLSLFGSDYASPDGVAVFNGYDYISPDGGVVLHNNLSEWYGRVSVLGRGERVVESLKATLAVLKGRRECSEDALSQAGKESFRWPMAAFLRYSENARLTAGPGEEKDGRVSSSEIGGILKDFGYKEWFCAPGMVLDLKDIVPDAEDLSEKSDGSDGIILIGENRLCEWYHALSVGYSDGLEIPVDDGEGYSLEGDGADYSLFLRSPKITMLGYQEGGKIVGTLMIFMGRTASFHELAVLPEYRGRGYARALMGAGVNIAAKSGYKKASLFASDAGYHLYESMGFKTCCEASHWKVV